MRMRNNHNFLLFLVKMICLKNQINQYLHQLWQNWPPSCTTFSRIVFQNIGLIEFFWEHLHDFNKKQQEIGTVLHLHQIWYLFYVLIYYVKIIQTATTLGQFYICMTLAGPFDEKPLTYKAKLIRTAKKMGLFHICMTLDGRVYEKL